MRPLTIKKLTLGITGASGSLYAQRMIDLCHNQVERLYVVMSSPATGVIKTELTRRKGDPLCLINLMQGLRSEDDKIKLFAPEDIYAPIASGSSAPDAMVVLPCSMGALARIAQGVSSNLLERSADVCMKERRPLIIVPRETPLNAIHLRNMLSLCEQGVHIVPAMPSFYHHPKTIDDLVDSVVHRILDYLGLAPDSIKRWNAKNI